MWGCRVSVMTMKTPPWVLLFLLLLLPAPEARACRYSVRDAGFVDLGRSTYRLYLFQDRKGSTGAPTPAQVFAHLADSNVRFEPVDPESPKGKALWEEIRDATGTGEIPAAVLRSPEGRFFLPVLPGPGPGAGEDARSALEGLVASPARERIAEAMLDAFCVVVLVEGKDPAANQAARREIDLAADRLEEIMPRMPKPVKVPPAVVTIPYAAINKEKVLLWSLGIEGEAAGEPAAAVLYGRARRIGPVLRGPAVQASFLYHLFLIVGADCECDLDRTWLRGVMIPLRWDAPLRDRAAKRLGFDPENPVVKMEVSRIVSLGSGEAGRVDPAGEAGDGLFGYHEEAVRFGETPPEEERGIPRAGETTAAPAPGTGSAAPPVAASAPAGGRSTAPDTGKEGGRTGPYQPSLVVLLGVGAAAAVGALLVLLRARGREG